MTTDTAGPATGTFEQYATSRLPVLLGVARAVCRDLPLAEDLTQDVLIKVHARWASISRLSQPDAYVRRMLVNEFISWRRKWSRQLPLGEAAETLAERRDPPAGSADHAQTLADRDALLIEVRRLPPKQRMVVALRYFADLGDADIADALGCAESTVRVHASRALAALRITTDISTEDR